MLAAERSSPTKVMKVIGGMRVEKMKRGVLFEVLMGQAGFYTHNTACLASVSNPSTMGVSLWLRDEKIIGQPVVELSSSRSTQSCLVTFNGDSLIEVDETGGLCSLFFCRLHRWRGLWRDRTGHRCTSRRLHLPTATGAAFTQGFLSKGVELSGVTTSDVASDIDRQTRRLHQLEGRLFFQVNLLLQRHYHIKSCLLRV